MIQHSNHLSADVNYQYLIDKLDESVNLKVIIVFFINFFSAIRDRCMSAKGLLGGLGLLGGVKSRKWAI